MTMPVTMTTPGVPRAPGPPPPASTDRRRMRSTTSHQQAVVTLLDGRAELRGIVPMADLIDEAVRWAA